MSLRRTCRRVHRNSTGDLAGALQGMPQAGAGYGAVPPQYATPRDHYGSGSSAAWGAGRGAGTPPFPGQGAWSGYGGEAYGGGQWGPGGQWGADGQQQFGSGPMSPSDQGQGGRPWAQGGAGAGGGGMGWKFGAGGGGGPGVGGGSGAAGQGGGLGWRFGGGGGGGGQDPSGGPGAGAGGASGWRFGAGSGGLEGMGGAYVPPGGGAYFGNMPGNASTGQAYFAWTWDQRQKILEQYFAKDHARKVRGARARDNTGAEDRPSACERLCTAHALCTCANCRAPHPGAGAGGAEEGD